MFEDFFDAQFRHVPVMGVFRSQGVTRTVALCEAAWDLGIDVVEVTIGHVDDVPSLYAVVAAGRDRGRSVGAGTVITPEQVHAAHNAGATFTASPGLDGAVLEESI